VDIIVKSKHCDVPAKVKDEAVERVTHATRFYDRLLGVEVVFGEEHNPRIAEPAVVELTARTKGQIIRAEGAAADHRGAVDVAIARFERQLRRCKDRLADRGRGRGRAAAPMTAVNGHDLQPTTGTGTAVLDDDAAPEIVRRKTFDLQPMLPEDAALQLELLDHDFYLFTNAMSGACNVVYRRRDGQLGLIEAGAGGGD
jgi:putative sigma-54 modulation protein